MAKAHGADVKIYLSDGDQDIELDAINFRVDRVIEDEGWHTAELSGVVTGFSVIFGIVADAP